MKLNNITLSNEIKLIIEATKIDKDYIKIEKNINSIHDWNKFIDLSYSHGVFPLVYNTLKKYNEIISKNFLTSMKQINMNIIKQNMFMTSELIKVMKLLEENGIEAISFKGPTLSQMAYGDISLRQYVDIDIFIKKENIYKIQELILTKAYKRNLNLEPLQEKTWLHHAHDIGFVNNLGITIEFHWSMLDTDHPVSLKYLNFFQNKSSLNIQKSKLNIISNEKFITYLCIHGAKHLFERIEWVVDIDKFIRNQEIDWDVVYLLVRKDNSLKFFLLGLYLSNKMYKTPIEKKFTELFDNDIIEVSNHIFTIWNDKKVFNNKNNLKYMLKLFVSFNDRIKYLHKIYLKPSFTEYWYITLPKPLYFLYYPLRQYLLIKKYFLVNK